MANTEEREAILNLRSFMLNDITEPAMKLLKTLFQRSCPFIYNIEFAINHNAFLIITRPDHRTLDPLDINLLWQFNADCTGDVLAFPINCFQDIPRTMPIRQKPGGFGHANLVIVNRLLRTVEHFDPHGDRMNDLTIRQQTKFETAVEDLFIQGPWATFRYLPPRRLCPTIGAQNLLIEHGLDARIKDSCRVWCYHFLMERLRYPRRTAAAINQSILRRLKAGPLNERLDKFIMDFIVDLYRAINVAFEHRETQICMRWPETGRRYCVDKKPAAATKRRPAY